MYEWMNSTFYFHKNNLNLIIFSSHFDINILTYINLFLFEVKPKNM